MFEPVLGNVFPRRYLSWASLDCLLLMSVSMLCSTYYCSPYIYIVLLMWLIDHLQGKSCSLGSAYVLSVTCLLVVLDISNFGLEDRIVVLVVPAPDDC